MNATRKVKLKDITSNLTCPLCSGYLVDATTVIECLHSFCKSCIITYLEKSADLEEKYCPVCDVQLHSTKPLTSIRSDLMLQEIVYKLVPGLFKNEMRRRREFYQEHDTCRPANPLDSGQVFDELYITSDDVMHLSMEYMTDDEKLRDSTRRYLKCPAAVGVFVLKKLLQGKYDLDKDTHIDIMFGDRILPDDFLLMDVAYKYSWAKNGNKPLDLRYRIKGTVKPTIKLERTINDSTVIAEPEPLKNPSQDDQQTTPTNKKKVCNENGSNIMTTEEIKHKPVKVPTNNGVIPGELTIAPIKHPNGKIKGRKRKHLNYSDIVIESKDDIKNLAKRLKLEKSTGSNKKLQSESFSSLAQLEITSSNNNEKCKPAIEVKEVQLQISENGVMSARSISCNGDDKVVYDLSKRVVSSSTTATASTSTSPTTSQNISLTEKLLLSGNFHSKTGPTGLTEIICDKPAPSSSSMKPTAPKPGYVTLNIPTPKNPINGRISSYTNDVGNKRFASDLNGSLSPVEKNQLKTSTNDKLKQKLATKDKDINGLTDLKKVCTGTSMEATDMMEMQRAPGKHSLPIIAPMSNPFQQQRTKISNGTPLKNSIDSYVLPAALNFSPASGMSVSMIPCTSSGGTNGTNTMDGTKSSNGLSYRNNTPPKRSVHQSSLTNGEIKIRPKPILPKVNGDHQEISPKKPPKFFKSRQTSSPVSPFNGKHNTSMSPKHDNNESKRKTPVPMMNVGSGEPTPKKINKERKDQQNETSLPDATAINFLNLLNAGVLAANAAQTSPASGMPNNGQSSNGLHALRQLANSPQVNEKYSQQLTALNNLATMQNGTDPLNSGLGIAAVAAAAAAAASNNGNGLPLGMTPFVTDNYCSLPFLNQRQPMAAQFPFAFNFPGVGYTGTTFLTTATTTPVNTSKPKSSPLPTGSSGILNGLLSTPSSAKVIDNDSVSTLDLSVAKSSAQENKSHTKSTDSNPLLVSLLNSTSKPKSPSSSKTENLARKSVSPDTKRPADSTVKIPDKSKSPLIRQLLEKREEKEKANASSPEKNNACVTTTTPNSKSDNDNRESPVNNSNTAKLNGNGINGATGNGSPAKPENCTKNNGKAVNSESKSPVPTNGCSPTIKNDTNANNESTKVALDTAKLLCLSAQNNNNTLSNNHDKSNDNSKSNGNGLDDRGNGTSDKNVPSTGTELVSSIK